MTDIILIAAVVLLAGIIIYRAVKGFIHSAKTGEIKCSGCCSGCDKCKK